MNITALMNKQQTDNFNNTSTPDWELMSQSDLQELSEAQDRKDFWSDFIDNALNKFRVLYFRQGYSSEEVEKKALEEVRKILKLEKQKEDAEKEGSPFDE